AAGQRYPAAFRDYGRLAHDEHRSHFVADEEHRTTRLADLAHLALALFLEGLIADRQHFIHDEDFRVHVGSDCKGEPYKHAAGVTLDRGIEELVHFGKGHDVI